MKLEGYAEGSYGLFRLENEGMIFCGRFLSKESASEYADMLYKHFSGHTYIVIPILYYV